MTSPGPVGRSPAGEPAAAPRARTTLVERVLEALPGPYVLWALVLAALFGTPGFIAARYLDTGSADRALSLFDWTPASVITYGLATFGLTLYALLGIRIMRSRTSSAERRLVPVVPGGREAMDRTLAPVTWVIPPLLLTPVLLAVSFAAYGDQIQDITGPAYFVVRIASLPIAYFVYATFIWVYLSSVKGLYDLGRGDLRLRSFLEDSHFGLKPFGSVSLSLALVYFVGLGLVVFSFLTLSPVFQALLVALALPGIVLFFLPLLAVHRRMVDEWTLAQAAFTSALERAKPFLNPATAADRPATPEDVRALLAYQILEERMSDVGEWPLDTRTVSWFSAIVLSVLAAIATRYVLTYLGG